MNVLLNNLLFAMALMLLSTFPAEIALAEGKASAQEEEPEKGPHRGRMLRDGDFVLELSIFETGVPPEFRVWVTDKERAVPPEDVKLTITLTRLGGVKDNIRFVPQSDFLRGNLEIYEPHSFVVTIDANYNGIAHHWQYNNFEGRTAIAGDIAQAMDIQTDIAGEVTFVEHLPVVGQIAAPKTARRNISARFDGLITKVHVSLGQEVSQGAPLFTVESNESLKANTIRAPLNGKITSLDAAEGELTNGRILLTLLDTSALVADVKVFPTDLHRIAMGQAVELETLDSGTKFSGTVLAVSSEVAQGQATPVRIVLTKPTTLPRGSFVRASIAVGEYPVPLAVKRSGLQSFRDFTVVYAKVGEQYEVRMLELGREAGDWVEVLGGLESGTEYVSLNSYIIKADIDKSGASHDH